MDPYEAKVLQHVEAALRELETLRFIPPDAELRGLTAATAKINERIVTLKKAIKASADA